MNRLAPAIVFCLAAVAAAVATLMLYAPAERGAPAAAPGTRAERWRALPLEEQSQLVGWYRAVARRPDAAVVLRRAREFAALDGKEQEALRLLGQELLQQLEAQPAARRRLLWSLHERARAEEVYRLLEREAPERIAALRRQLQGG